ncbi:transporter [Balneola vulgaris]|uniref:transporter n=1 Tax=Balneola vulgaris TaxID=287535 RepID=UPI00037F09D5|nr:transporter [Balneola vulgaris]
MKNLFIGVLTLSLCTTIVNAQWSAGRPDGHAPITVMGDHVHTQGEIMFSYRYMVMNMKGNGDGTDELSNDEVLRPNGKYMVAPTEMPMVMHMFGAMYAVSNDLTLMGMLPIISNEMDHITSMGGAFSTSSNGIGDVKISTLYNFYDRGNSKMHWQFGLSFPTGSLDERDDTPMQQDALLPYPMQLGSGSFDFLPALTYLTQNPNMSFGAQIGATIRLKDNQEDYRRSNELKAVSWLGYKLNDMFSPQLSLRYTNRSNYSGKDDRYDMALANDMVHTVDPRLKAESRLDLGLGLNIQGPEGPLHDLRLAANYDLPLYQYVDGPQMLMDGIFTVGLQYTIH